jgi:hypothetical protein
MFTITTYGTWLRGDIRGWVDDAVVFPPDPRMEDLDSNSMNEPPFRFAYADRVPVAQAIAESLTTRLHLQVYAVCVQSWHSHFVVGATVHTPAVIVKCAKDAARWKLRRERRIWGTGYDKRYCFDAPSVQTRINYVANQLCGTA